MSALALSEPDARLLRGEEGPARQTAMRILVHMAELQGARRFIDVTRAHVDGCIYTGEASLRFAETLAAQGGQVKVPTTMNAISLDRQRWRSQGVDPGWAAKADQLAMAYVRMGAQPTFTCAPYQLPDPPRFGEQIAWAESNAVVYANSVLGARTNRYGDFLDICAGLTGRVPDTGYHRDEARRATVVVKLPHLPAVDPLFYPVLGYLVGTRLDAAVPVIVNLPGRPGDDDLKAFGAAAATSGSIGMFHMVGVTPEAPTLATALGHRTPEWTWDVQLEELADAWRALTSADGRRVDLIALGNPHFSAAECLELAHLVRGERRDKNVRVMVTTSRHVYDAIQADGTLAALESFGADVITDTCWCMLNTPVIPDGAETLMTNSAKYAHYAPGLTGRSIYFASLEDCVRTAVTGTPYITKPSWLTRR